MRGKKYKDGGTASANTISNKDAMEMAKEDLIAITGEGLLKTQKDKMKAVFKAVTAGIADGPDHVISSIDEKFLKDAGKKKTSKSEIPAYRRNMGGTMKNYRDGGVGSKGYGTTNDRDIIEKTYDKLLKDRDSLNFVTDKDFSTLRKVMHKVLDKTPISTKEREFVRNIGKPSHIADKETRAKGGVASFAHGGVEAADKEGSRLSISMERQEDAGYSPSEADFDQQHRLAEEGIMEVGADVKIIQGHNSRASLGETKGVRGTGAMVKGTKFDGVF